MSNYKPDHSENENKELVRLDILQDLKANKNSSIKRIFTLPCEDFSLEVRATKLGFRVDTAENDTITFSKQFAQRDKLTTLTGEEDFISLNKGSASDFLFRNRKMQYTLAYLDFCGAFSQEMRQCLASLENRCRIIYVTVLKNREHGIYSNLFDNNTRHEVYETLFSIFGYRITKTHEYINNRCPMCVYRIVKDGKVLVKSLNITSEETKPMILERFILHKKKRKQAVKYGSFNGAAKFPKITFGTKAMQLGFDPTKKYEVGFDPKTFQLLLIPSKKYDAYTLTKVNTSNAYKMHGTFLRDEHKVDSSFHISSMKLITEGWIIQLTKSKTKNNAKKIQTN